MPALVFLGAVAVLSVWGLVTARGFVLETPQPWWKGEWARRFETHYESRFPIKRFGVNLWAAFDYKVLGEGRPGVVLGRDGWLFTAEEFQLDEQHAEQLTRNLVLVARTQDALKQQGIELMVLIVPAKARVYAEKLATQKPPAAHRVLHAQLLADLNLAGVMTSDALPTLLAAKEQRPSYLRTDTHWSPWGAERAAAVVAASLLLHGLVPPSTEARYESVALDRLRYEGDLLSFLPLAPAFATLLPAADELQRVRTETVATEAAPSSEDSLFGSSAAPRIALVGTSYSANSHWNFAGALREALQEDLVNYAREGLGPFKPMAEFLKAERAAPTKPRWVIWEIPERAMLQVQPADLEETLAL